MAVKRKEGFYPSIKKMSLTLIWNHRRDPMFAFVFEGTLFEFAYDNPSFAPLFALPPNNRPPIDRPNFFSNHSNQNLFPLPRNVTNLGKAFRFLISFNTYRISCEPVKNFSASLSGASRFFLILTSV